MFGSTSNCSRRHLLIFLGLALLVATFVTNLVDADQQPEEQSEQCVFGHLADQTVWLKGNLTFTFNASEGCEVITLTRNGETLVPLPEFTRTGRVCTFHVSSITEDFNNATMILQGRGGGQHKLLNSTEFKVLTVDNVSAVINLTYSSNCTHTIVEWSAPYSHGLMVTGYYYELRLNDTVMESGVTIDPYVVFNLTSLPANDPGYTVLLWARAPPGNSTVTNSSLLAALVPNVSYDMEVIIESQEAFLVFVGEVDQSCPTSYPTDATISFSCVPDKPTVLPVDIGVNETTVEIHSNAIETGHTNCNVTIISNNLSDKNTSESFVFNSTDVQQLVARPLNNTGAIFVWMELAMNSSLQEIMVNVFNSRGILEYSTTANRSLQEEKVTLKTDILPIDWYTVCVQSTYNKSLTINETVNITHSNYSTPSVTLSPSPSLTLSTIPAPSSTSAPIPTNNDLLTIVVLIVVGVLVIIVIVILGIILCLCLMRKRRKRSYSVSRSRSRAQRSRHRRASRPVQVNAGDDKSVLVSSGGSVTTPRPYGQITSSIPSSPAEHYHSIPQEAPTPNGQQQLLVLNNSLPVSSAGSEMVASQTTTFTEDSTVNSDQPLIRHSSYTPPSSSLPAAVAQRPVQETTTTADSEQQLLPKDSSSHSYGTVNDTTEGNVLSYQAIGEQESTR